MKYISVFLLLVASVLGEWQGCIQENQEDNKVTKGKQTPVCLNVAIDAGNWADQTSFRTYSFTPEADDYSRFIIAGCKCYIALVISITMWQCWNCSFCVLEFAPLYSLVHDFSLETTISYLQWIFLTYFYIYSIREFGSEQCRYCTKYYCFWIIAAKC